jgi:hypothetical protein
MIERMVKTFAAVASVSLLGVACAGGDGVSPTGQAGNPTSPAAVIEPIDLPPLPPQGIVVQEGKAVRLVGLDGLVIVHLLGFELANPSDPPGVVLLMKGDRTYLLRVDTNRLQPVTASRAEHLAVRDDREVDLPLPHGILVTDGDPSGHWRWARPSPDGTWVLAQWSGECEVPRAFMVGSDDGVPEPVTGEWGLRHGPESIGLGWAPGGKALIDLPVGYCGGSAKRPGAYLFARPGEAVLVYPHPQGARVRMWGTA